MSQVISFRLNGNNQREAEALNVLKRWQAQDFSIRNTITEALLKLDFSSSQEKENRALNDLSLEIKELLDNIETCTSLMMHNGELTSEENLSDGFVNSVLKSAKPGLKIKTGHCRISFQTHQKAPLFGAFLFLDIYGYQIHQRIRLLQ